LIRRLDAEWRVLAGSRLLRDRLRTWGAGDERLAFEDGDRLVAAAQRRDAASWAERDQVLAALLERVIDDALARRVALQVVLPGVKSLINGIRGWDVEERAARVVATALAVISWCATEPAGTPPSFRIYTNTRRRVLRSAVRARSEPVVFVDDYSHLEADEDPVDGKSEAQEIDELVEWVQQRARVRDDAARLVVMTRVAGVPVDEVAAAQDVDPQTLRQRRLRTERLVRQSLVLSR
jgi:DNA-directed RNA polymerase specialized sigma24 family protein